MAQFLARVVLNKGAGKYRDLHNSMFEVGFHPSVRADNAQYQLPEGMYFSNADIDLKQAISKVRKAVRKSYARIKAARLKQKWNSAAVLVAEVSDFEWSGLVRYRRPSN